MDAAPTSQSYGVVNIATGSFTGDGTAIEVTLGFQPRYIRLFNRTDLAVIEKFEAMTDAQTLQEITAGTKSLQTGSQITIQGGDADGDTFRGFTVAAAAAGSGDVCDFVAYG